jgi:hypothetical protein
MNNDCSIKEYMHSVRYMDYTKRKLQGKRKAKELCGSCICKHGAEIEQQLR